jgi:hypothetical protein
MDRSVAVGSRSGCAPLPRFFPAFRRECDRQREEERTLGRLRRHADQADHSRGRRALGSAAARPLARRSYAGGDSLLQGTLDEPVEVLVAEEEIVGFAELAWS